MQCARETQLFYRGACASEQDAQQLTMPELKLRTANNVHDQRLHYKDTIHMVIY